MWKKGLRAKVVQAIEDELLEKRFAALSAEFPGARSRAIHARALFTDGKLRGTDLTAGDLRSLLVHTLLEVE